MIKGSTVIMSEDYIADLTRHRDTYKKLMENEPYFDAQAKYRTKYEMYEEKLNKALEFQDTIEEIINVEIPKISVVKTVTGLAIPLRNLQVL